MKPEVNGALAIKRSFPLAVIIFFLPDKFSHLRLRLAARRAESNEEIAARLATAPPERRHSLPAVDDLEAIVRAERFRIRHYKGDELKKLENS